MVAQAVVAYIIAMLIMNGQETAKLKKEMADRSPAKVECKSEKAGDCQSTQEKK